MCVIETLPQLTVRALRVRAVEITPERAMETASGTLGTTPLALIDLITGEGLTGSSYVRCYAPAALRPLAALISALEPLIAGGPAVPAVLDETLQRYFRLLGPQGLTGIAMAGIDMALWDALAKAAGVPLVTLLGGEPKPIKAYASLRSMSPQPAAEEAEALLAHGFTAIKVKVGRGDLAADLATIRAVRAAIGSAVQLMVDYNQSLSVEGALERGRALENEGLAWIEEPTRADDYAGHARIAAALQTPIQLGENDWGPHDVEKHIAAQASDHLMLDAMKGGGVTGWLRSAALAANAGLPVSSHAFPEYSVHLLGVTPTATWLEYLDHVGPILAEPVRIENGYAVIPDRAGSGLVWDEDALRPFGS